MTQTNDPPLVASVALIPDSDEKADLDAPSSQSGKLVVSQAPNITITSTSVVADQAERLSLDPQEGDIAIQQDTTESFIFTGGANELANWQLVQFDAVGGIAGEDIAPRDIDGRNVTLTDLSVNGLLNGADTSGAAAGEALTSDGTGGFGFASVGGIEEVQTFGDLPAIDPPQLAYVVDQDEYYRSKLSSGFFDINTRSLDKSINTQDGNPKGIAWNNDGSRLYEIGSFSNKIYQLTLSSPFDISTASFETSINNQDNFPQGIAWNDDGSRLYEMGSGDPKIYQYTVSTPFDIASASFSNSFTFSQSGTPRGLAWNNDGSRLYINTSSSALIYQFTVSTPFDATTASFDTSINAQDGFPVGIAWNDDGSRLYEVGTNGGKIYESTLSNPFDITSASFSTSIPATDEGTDIAWNNDGTRLYELENGPEKIFQSTIGKPDRFEEF